MKTFKQFVTETTASIGSVLEKHGFKDTADQRGYGKPDPVYTSKKPVEVSKMAPIMAAHGFKRVTHYARGGPNSRMPESGPHMYKKEAGYGGSEHFTVHHDGKHVRHILHGSSRSSD